MKRRIWKLEYSVMAFILTFLFLLSLPVSIENNFQARLISKWNEKFNRAEYIFSVIDTYMADNSYNAIKNLQTEQDKEDLILHLIKPYFRIDMDRVVSKRYSQKYMNGTKVMQGQSYFFDEIYYLEDKSIIGIKDLEQNNYDVPRFMMMFDLNGTRPPNVWGRDIFGIYVFEKGVIEPFGSDMSMTELEQECSSFGTGVACSYYYKIGGGFSDL